MSGPIFRLETPGIERPLEGAHLDLDLRSRASVSGAYVYSGFLSSLDGRVGIDGHSGPPAAIANGRDWRLFSELIAQADVVLASGRYVRDAAAGTGQGLLPRPGGPFDDLIAWRTSRGLPPRPAVAILTRDARFDPETAAGLADDVYVVTGKPLGEEVAGALSRAAVTPLVAGPIARPEGAGDGEWVDGDALIEALGRRGLRVVCSAAGPHVLRSIAHRLDALFLTLAGRLVGGRAFSTLLHGPELEGARGFEVGSILLDRDGPGGAHQLFIELVRR